MIDERLAALEDEFARLPFKLNNTVNIVTSMASAMAGSNGQMVDDVAAMLAWSIIDRREEENIIRRAVDLAAQIGGLAPGAALIKLDTALAKMRQGRRIILTGAQFIAAHVPPVWLIEGIVQRSRLYACTSLTAHGKTAVWLYNACFIHAGRGGIGTLRAFRGNVLYLAGENPTDLQARMIGMVKAFDLDPATIPYVLPATFPLTDDEANQLADDIAALGAPLSLIVGDTASSFFPGEDENSNAEMGAYARRLREFTSCSGNPAIVMLCHPTKQASKDNLLPRGGSAFLNELDGNLTLWSDSPGELTCLHWQAKIRGPEFAPLDYRLRTIATGLADEHDNPEFTVIAEPISDEAATAAIKKRLANENTVLKALAKHPTWSHAEIASYAGWFDNKNQAEKWKVQRAIVRLKKAKMITQDRDGDLLKLTERGKKALKNGDDRNDEDHND